MAPDRPTDFVSQVGYGEQIAQSTLPACCLRIDVIVRITKKVFRMRSALGRKPHQFLVDLEWYRNVDGIASFLPVGIDTPMIGLLVIDQLTSFEGNCVRDRKAKPAHDENQSAETRAPPISRLPVHIQRNPHLFDRRQQLFELRSCKWSCSPFSSARIFSTRCKGVC